MITVRHHGGLQTMSMLNLGPAQMFRIRSSARIEIVVLSHTPLRRKRASINYEGLGVRVNQTRWVSIPLWTNTIDDTFIDSSVRL